MTKLEKILLSTKIIDTMNSRNRNFTSRLTLSEEHFELTESHLGGIPYMPHNMEIPTNQNGDQLWLCAQINFSEMPPLKHFPKKGILQLFLCNWHYDCSFGIHSSDFTEQVDWKVIYHETIDETVTREDVAKKMTTTWEAPSEADASYWRAPNIPLKITYNPIEIDNMDTTDYRFTDTFRAIEEELIPEAEPLEYLPYGLKYGEEEFGAIKKLWEKQNNGGCKIGGYSRHAQLDPRDYDDNDDLDILLFQLDDNRTDYPVGDIDYNALNLSGGTLNFFINHKDLEDLNFSKVLADWACS